MKDPNSDAKAEIPGIIKVIGVGQSLRGDDAAGLIAVRHWLDTCQARHGYPNVHVELSELPGLGLLSLLEGSRFAILVDAMHSNARPGTVQVLNEDQLAAFQPGSGSAHGWGVAETISFGRQLMPSTIPEKIVLIGIQVGQINLGEGLSPEVASAFPKVARLIEQFVRQANLTD